jgi:phage recombination protein Bet
MNEPKEKTTTETEAIAIPDNDKATVEIIPFGTNDRIKLSAAIVRTFIAQPTRTGKMPDDKQCIRFIMLCKARHLNPFEGDAYMLGYDTQTGPQFSLITAHQVFLKRAEASKGFDGMESGVIVQGKEGGILEREGDLTYDGEKLIGGWAKVYRKDRKIPFYRRLKLSVFNTSRSRWEKDPAGMIVKCAEADSLRTAFPTHLGGLYVEEELPPIDVAGGLPRLEIKRARVPVPELTGGEETNNGKAHEAAASPSDNIGAVDDPNAHVKAWEKFTPTESPAPAEKKSQKLVRKRKDRLSTTTNSEFPNRVEMEKRLIAGNKTTGDLVQVGLENGWISEDEKWPLSEEKLARFLSEDSWPVVTEALDDLEK